MRIRITIITVYYSQSDDQSEHTNQTVKIILQYILKDVSNADFINFLSAFKQMFNNNINAFTEQISNEIIYEFNFMNFFNIIIKRAAKKFEIEHKIHQQEVQNSIT